MTDRGLGKRGVGDGVADLFDVVDENIRSDTGILLVQETGGGDAIEVLASDRYTRNERAQIVAVLADGLLQGRQLVGEAGITGRSPETEEQRSFGRDGSRNSRNRVVGSSSLL